MSKTVKIAVLGILNSGENLVNSGVTPELWLMWR